MSIYKNVNEELQKHCRGYIAVTGPECLTLDASFSVEDLRHIIRIMENNKQALEEDQE